MPDGSASSATAADARTVQHSAVQSCEGAMTSFLIIDDHPLFREALGNAVRLALPEARIVEAMSIEDALHILTAEQGEGIDLALLDLLLPDATGFSGFLRLREAHPRLPVAIVARRTSASSARRWSSGPRVFCRSRCRSASWRSRSRAC